MSESTVKLLNNPYGQVTFNLFRQEEQAFVDKSLMIKFLDDKGMSKYPVLLRPRRFGKSTFVQMLKCYYDISYQDRYEELFSGTKIYEENLPTHNSYHVIDFDFSAVSTGNLNKLLATLNADIKILILITQNLIELMPRPYLMNLQLPTKITRTVRRSM